MDRTALASAVVAVTMGLVAALQAQLLPHIPCGDTQPRRLAATHAPTAPLTAEQLYVVAAALLADGRASSTTTARRRLREAYKGRSAMHQTRGKPHSAGAAASGMRAMAHTHPGLSRGRHWCCRRQATRPSYTATPEGTGRTSLAEAAGLSGTAPPGKGHSRPCPTSTGSRGPPRPTICRRTPGRWQSCYTPSAPPTRGRNQGGSSPPALVWSPDQEENLRAAWQGDAIRDTDVPDLCAGPITHARPAATLAVAQRGQRNPQWVVCMFSPADAHIVVCDPERLPGPEAVVRVADCTRMIVKALREGEHHALLLQVRLKDNARAARPGVWPAAAHPADPELQLAVPTTVYHWLQAFHDLRWRGKPDRQIGSTHWQTWLQADVQRDAIRGLGPAPATRALDPASPGRTLAPHTVPLANLPFEPAAEGAIQKSVPLLPARGATEPTKCPLCADKDYTSGALLEHLAWHAVHAESPGGRQGGSLQHPAREGTEVPWNAAYARRPPPQAADHADGDEEAPGAAPGTGGAGQPGSIPAELAPLAPLTPPAPRAPLWAPLGTGSADAARLDALAAPANPAAMPMRDS